MISWIGGWGDEESQNDTEASMSGIRFALDLSKIPIPISIWNHF